MTRPTWQLALGLLVLLWAVYLLVYSGTFLVIDEQHIFAVAESIALRGAVDANQVRFAPDILPASGSFGLNGDYFTVYGPATSYLAAPLVRLAWALPQMGAAQASLLLPPLLTTLTAVLVFLYVQRLVGSPRAGLATALLFGLCTLALPYTKWLYTEPLSALALFGTAGALLRYRDRGDFFALALAGGLAGLAVATKLTNGIALPAFMLYAVWVFRRGSPPTFRRATWAALAFGLPLAAFLAALGWFNLVRFGNPLSTGYAAYGMQFTTPLWEGLWGLLLSPGKSFFLYSPILLLWPFALPAFLRRHTAEALLCLAVSGVLLVVYALYFAWPGGACWGPRYIVPLVPFFAVGTAPALRWLWERRARRIILLMLVVLSVGVQFLGVAVKPTHYFSLLDRQFPNAEMNTALLFDWRYSPLLGHATLALNPHNYNLAWLHRPTGLAGRGVEGALAIDGLSAALTLTVATLALVGLFARRGRRAILALALAGAALAPGVLLARYYDDPRYGGDDTHWALLRHLEAHVAPADAVISHDEAHINFYLNYSRVTAPWFGVPREALPLSAETDALLERLVREHSRIWLILPHTPPGDPGSGVERWLAERAYPATNEPFGPDLRLASFAVPGPLTWRDSGVTLGDAVRLEMYALPEGSDPGTGGPGDPGGPGGTGGSPGGSLNSRLGRLGLGSRLASGDTLCLALRWRCLAPLDADYTVFVQVLGPAGPPVAQSDRPPVAGFRPTSDWQPGEVITDHHGVPLPPDLPPGEYRLIAGLYRADTGARLPTPLGDFVDLGVIQVMVP